MLLLILHTAKLLFPCSSARSTPLGLGDIRRDPPRLIQRKEAATVGRPPGLQIPHSPEKEWSHHEAILSAKYCGRKGD